MPILDELAAVVATRIKASQERCTALEQEILRTKAECELIITRELARDRERLAALEARPPAPGPPGADGAPGKDGTPGPKGDPGMQYRGVYQEATGYDRGDVVTWAGGAWHCNEATTEKPGDGLSVWTLMVKRGRDGRGAR